jgi:hypothetical protein
MAGIISIFKDETRKVTRVIVARDNVQVNMPILVLQKGIVEMDWREGVAKHAGCAGQLFVQIGPFGSGQVRDMLKMPSEDEKAVPKQVLVVVQDEAPIRTFSDQRR